MRVQGLECNQMKEKSKYVHTILPKFPVSRLDKNTEIE
jgi:hypothetical protein